MALSTSPELYRQIETVETFIGIAGQTMRPIRDLAYQLRFRDQEDFKRYIHGKEVLDIGSGLNGLAIDVILQNIPARVTSINPLAARPDFEARQKAAIELYSPHLFSDSSPEDIETARKEANRNTLPLFAHDLRGLADASFDVVIDNMAVFFYADRLQKLALVKSIEEMQRVCRGSIRVGDPARYGEIPTNWKEMTLREMGIKYSPYGIGFEIPSSKVA